MLSRLPTPRGPLSALVVTELVRPVHALPAVAPPTGADPIRDDDLHLALFLLYELHFRGLPGVEDRWEWEPSVLALRGALEDVFEAGLLAAAPRAGVAVPPAGEVDVAMHALADGDPAPSLARHLERDGTREQLLELLAHKSTYLLKEADPQAFAIPRLEGPPKAAMVEILADEYGGGRPDRVHALLYAEMLEAVGLDPSYGAYVEHAPGVTLASVNLMSFFGLHRRLRGAAAGHLALYEMTSSVAARRNGAALRRLGFDTEAAVAYFDEHVAADAVHESIALVDLAGGIVRHDPQIADSVLWGARCSIVVDGAMAEHVKAAWDAGRSSLRVPLELPAAA